MTKMIDGHVMGYLGDYEQWNVECCEQFAINVAGYRFMKYKSIYRSYLREASEYRRNSYKATLDYIEETLNNSMIGDIVDVSEMAASIRYQVRTNGDDVVRFSHVAKESNKPNRTKLSAKKKSSKKRGKKVENKETI